MAEKPSPTSPAPAADETVDASRKGLTHRTLVGFFWSFSGTGVQAVLQIVVLAVLGRLLTPEDFGLVAAALVVVSFTNVFNQLGVGPAIVQRPEIRDEHIRVGQTITLILGAALTALVWSSAPLIASFFDMKGLTPILKAISFVFILNALSVMAQALVQRELNFRLKAGIQITTYVFGYGGVGVVMAYLGYGPWALVWANLAQAGVSSILFIIARPHPKRPLVDRGAAKELLAFGGGFTIGRIFNQVAIEGDNLVVGRWLGADALGLYGRAYQLMAMPATLFGKVLDKVLFPAMAKVQSEPDVLASVYRRGVVVIALLIMPTSAVLFVMAPEFVTLLLGEQWLEIVLPFRIFALGMLLRTSYKMSDSLARATGAVYRRAWRQALYAGGVLGGAWVGQHWGIEGVAAGVLAALILNFLLMAGLSMHLTAMTWGGFARIHAQASFLTGVVFVETWLLADLFRGWEANVLVTLLGVSVAVGLTALSLAWFLPALVLGKDGLWLVKTLSGYLPKRVSRHLGKLQTKPQGQGG